MHKAIEVKIPCGLHTRPAGRLASLAQQYRVECFIHYDNQIVSALSILDLISLMVPNGAIINLEVHGSNSDIFLQKATDLLNDAL